MTSTDLNHDFAVLCGLSLAVVEKSFIRIGVGVEALSLKKTG